MRSKSSSSLVTQKRSRRQARDARRRRLVQAAVAAPLAIGAALLLLWSPGLRAEVPEPSSDASWLFPVVVQQVEPTPTSTPAAAETPVASTGDEAPSGRGRHHNLDIAGDCAACHRVHTAVGEELLVSPVGNQLCQSCHRDRD